MFSQSLQPEFLIRAYTLGAFPMADEQGQINWFNPDPRAILKLDQFKVSRSLRQRIKKGGFEVVWNRCFETVIRSCADRPDGTWVSEEIIQAYYRLHRLGFAHSVEVYYGSQLAGGLYGVSLGGAFFGESMFTRLPDGSKLALVALVERMRQKGLTLLDIQMMTDHLARFGAALIPRSEYFKRLEEALRQPVAVVEQNRLDSDISIMLL